MPDQTTPRYHYFVAPGTIRVSKAALALARAFEAALQRIPTASNTIATFDWASARTLHKPPGGPTIELGPGLDLGSQERTIVPPEFLLHEDGLDFAIQIPPWIYEASRERLIDVEPGTTKLVLR